MKQLKKLVLHKTTPLTVPQMKHITGGYEGDGYDNPFYTCSTYEGVFGCKSATSEDDCLRLCKDTLGYY